MLFNSLDFAIFLPIIFTLYWITGSKNIKAQNVLITIASYIFYGWWDWRFLGLIFISTVLDYLIGLALSTSNSKLKRKFLLSFSILINLGFLGFFKYYNFFIESFSQAFSFFGLTLNTNSLNIILPVGISFYTFQTLSYSIDVYREKLKPTRDFTAFAAFVCFFPQLVAGPIERAVHLLPQFNVKRKFDLNQASDGLRQILWGLFKKIVIADNCAEYANLIFGTPENYNSSSLIIGAVFFAFQIYGDFSGYSDIAIGTSRLFGFDLKKNFAFPYFSRDIAEFWRRWHISLSTWFRDYLYIPLGGSRGSTGKKIRNVFIIFLVSGFWHGANWTFIIWGAINALYFLPLMLRNKNRDNLDEIAKEKILPSVFDLISIIKTFALTVFAWIFFRADSLDHAILYIKRIFISAPFSKPNFNLIDSKLYMLLVTAIGIFLVIEWLGRFNNHALETTFKQRSFRYILYSAIIISIILLAPSNDQTFIYFQF